jgi:hypothetical protein
MHIFPHLSRIKFIFLDLLELFSQALNILFGVMVSKSISTVLLMFFRILETFPVV